MLILYHIISICQVKMINIIGMNLTKEDKRFLMKFLKTILSEYTFKKLSYCKKYFYTSACKPIPLTSKEMKILKKIIKNIQIKINN